MVLSVVRRLFHKHRYIGNAIFYTGLLSAADVVSQKIQYGVISEHDFARTGRMATMGFVYFGPALTFIYDNLDKMLPGNARKTIIKKMLIDQTMITSLSMVVFYVGDVELNPGPTTTSTNSHSENSAVELPTLVARANLHQGDASFSEESRGRQCGFMALTSLAYHHHELAVTNWQPETLDEILIICDSQFLDALQRALIPDGPNLSVEQLPTTVCFATANEDNNNLSFVTPSVTKPIVVLPLMATKANTLEIPIEAPNSDFPIVERESESPLVAMNSELPIVATKATVARPKIDIHSKLNEFDDSGMSALERKSWDETKKELKKKYLPTYVTSFLVWPTAQAINFALVPTAYRVVYISTVAFFWTVLLSYIKNKSELPYMLELIEDLTKEKEDILTIEDAKIKLH